MTGLTLQTSAPPQLVRDTMRREAQEQGYRTTSGGDWTVSATAGNRLVAFLLCGLFVPYCQFQVTVTLPVTDAAQLTLEQYFVVGLLGSRGVHRRAQALFAVIAAALRAAGYTVELGAPP